MSNNSWKISWIFPLLVLFLTWSLLGAYITVFARSWLWLLVGCVFVLIICPSYYTQRSMVWMGAFIIMVFLNYISGDRYYNNIISACYEFEILLFSSVLAYFCFQQHNERTAVVIIVELFIIITVSSIATYLLDLVYPGILRKCIGEVTKGTDPLIMRNYLRLGMANYSLPHALPIIVPPLIMGIKNKEQKFITRIVLTVVLFLTILLIYVSGVATAILITVMVLFMAVFTRVGNVKHNSVRLAIIVLLFMPFLFNSDLTVSAIDFICDLVGRRGVFYYRLVDIQESIIYDQMQGDVSARVNLYTLSFDAFLSSILWGSNIKMGGHSALLDRLATLGLIGFVPYVVFIWKQMKTTYVIIPPNSKTFYLEGLLAGVIMLMTKNMSNWDVWLMMFFLLPAIILRFGSKDNTEIMSSE